MKKNTVAIGTVGLALFIIPFAYAHKQKRSTDSHTAISENSSLTHQRSIASASSEIPEKREFKINDKVNPCDDFHAYVCSDAESNFKLRDDRSMHSFAFSDSDERLLEKKKGFFKNIEKEKNLKPRSEQMRDYYKACMNEKEGANEELKLVANLKKEVEKVKSIKDYIELNKQNMLNEKFSFISYGISPNIDNSKIYDMYFDLNFMFLPEHSYFDNKELIVAYETLITDFFKTIYPDQTESSLKSRAQAVVKFETQFKDSYPRPAEFRQRWTQPRYVTREEFFKSSSVIGLEKFFDKNVPMQTLVRNFMPESFEFVQKELKEENLQALKDLYVFRSAREFMDDAYPELYKKRLEFSHKFLGGPLSRPDRQERCTESVMAAFDKELDQEMIPRLFKNFPKDKMKQVAEKVRASIVDGLKTNQWLSEESKKGAVLKITSAKLQLMQPETEKEWDFKPIQKYSSTKKYENAKRLALLSHKLSLKKLKEGVNQDAWGMGPLTVNAYYDPTKNKFVMPMGILQYPFFVPEGDLIENLGAVGAVVAHELGHGIDDEGAKFDSKGSLRQWMTDDDIKKFQERGQKMIDQFNKIGHNGVLTLGENVADLVGLTFAYKAAFKDGKGSLEDKQKFFKAYGRLWCTVAREKTIEMLLKTDPHSMGYARINEQVKHQPGFSEAFKCDSKNKLYLSDKERIQIW